MNFNLVEQENLQQAICGAARMTPGLAMTIPELQSIDAVIGDLRANTDVFKAIARYHANLAQRVLRHSKRGFDDVLDTDGRLGIALEDAIKLALEKGASIEAKLLEVDGMERDSNEDEILECAKECYSAFEDVVETLRQVRSALISHDRAPAEVALSPEQIEQVQRCMETRKEPSPKIAASVEKMRGLLRGPSLSA